jgi:hypothetical protein
MASIRLQYTLFGWLLLMLSFLQGWAQVPSQINQINVLLIHGRNDSTKGEQFGRFTFDQAGFWKRSNGQELKPVTGGHVWYIQWDAWRRKFDDTTCPGGQCIINNAANALCNSLRGQECWIICHSAGCAAFENYLAKSNYATNPLLFAHVIAADSAAGGSELADNGLVRFLGGIFGGSAPAGGIDDSLKTGYARTVYNHNNMQGLVVRGVGGATDNYNSAEHFLIACNNLWPSQTGNTANMNGDCTDCSSLLDIILGHRTKECDDGAVALHSTCGHNRKASFQDCNSTLSPHADTAGTFNFHGWWVTDHECNPNFNGGVATSCNWAGPYSSTGGSVWNRGFKTYHVNHSDGKSVAVDEYTSAPAVLCP